MLLARVAAWADPIILADGTRNGEAESGKRPVLTLLC
jgi:hypothetical protein